MAAVRQCPCGLTHRWIEEAWDFDIWCHVQNAKRLRKVASLATAVDVQR